uniref:Uncharacterized protein n=2 Tax=Branchiostoma floridae TaxID=7739 RepID=C3Z663_BRAFL|eukprot:XP_002595977.1 hypothetical protein BRAFLDRAFT_128082 [Branchiostoma floridae]
MATAGVGKVLNSTDKQTNKAGKDKDVWVWKTRTEKARKTEVLREIDQMELKIKNLEREKTTHLYSKRSDFRQQFCELEDLEMKGNTDRKTEKVRLRQQLDKMRGMVKKFHIQLKDVKPTPEFLEKLKVTMEEIETTISAFKDQRRLDYEELLRDERTLTQEVTALEKKMDAWAQGPAGVAMETKGAKTKNLSVKNNVMKDLPPEVAAFERFLAQTGGHQGGWDDYDHQAFLKTRTKFRYVACMFQGKAAFLDEAVRACPGRTIGNTEKEDLLKQADEDSSSDDEEMLTARSKQMEQEREEKRKQLNAWKVQKELQRAQDEERKLKEELSKAKQQEKERERQAAVRAQVEEYRRQRQEEEEEQRREQEERHRQERARKQVMGAEEMSRFQERDQRMVEEKLAKEKAREEAMKEKNKRLERLKGQVEVKVERDRSRLYQPTALWKQRNKEIGPSGGGRVLHMTHRFFSKLTDQDMDRYADRYKQVIYKDGSWWAYFGNRRLWILREVERLGRCAAVECIVLPKDFCSDEKWLKKLKNRDEGQSVGVEKTERFDVEYQTIIEAWRKKTIYGMDAPTQLEVMMGKEAGTPKTARGGKVFTFPNGTSGSSQTKSATKNMGQFFKDLVLCSVIVSTSAIGALTMVSYFLGNSLIATTMKSILADLDFPFDWAEEERLHAGSPWRFSSKTPCLNAQMEAVKKKLANLRQEAELAKEKCEEAENARKEAEDRAEQAENDIESLRRKMQLLEADLDTAETSLKETNERNQELESRLDEAERSRQALEHRSTTEDDKSSQMETDLKLAKEAKEEMELKYEEVSRKLVMAEQQLDNMEDKYKEAEQRVKALEEELQITGDQVRSLESSQNRGEDEENSLQSRYRELQDTQRETETRAEAAERKIQLMETEISKLEDQLEEVKEKYQGAKADLDAALNELNEM